MAPTTHVPGRLRPARARLGDRLDLVVLGVSAGYCALHGGQVLDSLSIESLVGRTGALVYLWLFVVIGVVGAVATSIRLVGALMYVAAMIVFTLAAAAIVVRGLEGALLPVAMYFIAGRRLADRAWYLEADHKGPR